MFLLATAQTMTSQPKTCKASAGKVIVLSSVGHLGVLRYSSFHRVPKSYCPGLNRSHKILPSFDLSSTFASQATAGRALRSLDFVPRVKLLNVPSITAISIICHPISALRKGLQITAQGQLPRPLRYVLCSNVTTAQKCATFVTLSVCTFFSFVAVVALIVSLSVSVPFPSVGGVYFD